jgi:hypothetical protein
LTYPGDAIFVTIAKNTSLSGGAATITNVKDNYGDALSYLKSGLEVNANLTVYDELNLAHSGTFDIWVNWSGSLSFIITVVAYYAAAASAIDAVGSANTGTGAELTATVTTTAAKDKALMAVTVGVNTNVVGTNGVSQVVMQQATDLDSGFLSKTVNTSQTFTEYANATSGGY